VATRINSLSRAGILDMGGLVATVAPVVESDPPATKQQDYEDDEQDDYDGADADVHRPSSTGRESQCRPTVPIAVICYTQSVHATVGVGPPPRWPARPQR
jgi:hypothetical protein